MGYEELATEKQVAYVHSLASQRVLSVEDDLRIKMVDLLSKREASELIDDLKLAPKKVQREVGYQKPLEVGMYHTDTGETLRAYMGKQSGRLLVKKIVLQGSDYKYVYVGSASRVIAGETSLGPVRCERMSLAEAKTWGRMTSHCIVCGKQLTDPDSVDVGIGPVCAGKV